MNWIRRLIILLLILLIFCFGLTIIGYSRYQVKMVKPYEEFLTAEKETVPLFDTLNEDIYRSLPPLPPNSSLQKTAAIGIIAPLYEHGRWLRVEVSTNQTKDFILEYYGAFLMENDWRENTNHHAFDNAFYYKETSCIELRPPSDNSPDYTIEIWHDFRNQSFSPEIPDAETMSWFELGMTNVATCP